MTKHSLNILGCSHRNIFKVVRPFFIITLEEVQLTSPRDPLVSL